jgi:hypothetical protein
MMIVSCSESQQDTVKIGNVGINESIRIKTYSLPAVRKLFSKDSVKPARPTAPILLNVTSADTASVCSRNSISDITFYDSTNFILTTRPDIIDRSLFMFSEKSRQRQAEEKAILVKHLKPGLNIPVQPLHEDWIILIIIISAFLISFIRTKSKSVLPGVARFFLFRGINDPSSRDTGGLFNRQSTILNLVSFLIISLFSYCFASFYDFIPAGISEIAGYLIILGLIISAVTIRHIVCLITGSISGERDAFREYIIGIYQSYRFSALILFIIIVLLFYTFLLPANFYFVTGIVAISLMYFLRVVRLFIIFINRNISIFYLILYLCALEILPVGILVKYFTGLF